MNCGWCYCELQIYNLKKMIFNITADDCIYIESELPARIFVHPRINKTAIQTALSVESENELNFLDWGFNPRINRTKSCTAD